MEKTNTRNGPIIISVAGKGGTGKTSITALLLRSILEKGAFEEILIIDADPASNIPDILGVRTPKTIGSIVDSRKRALDSASPMECGLLRDEIMTSITSAEKFDYLVMGRTTGKGCYCPLNSVLSRILDESVKLYDLVLIDFDAGLEHFSRQTDTRSDVLIVVTDPSRMGFETARRIKQLTDEIGYSYRRKFLLGCGFTPDMEGVFSLYAKDTGLLPLGVVPYDSNLMTLNLKGENIFRLDSDSAPCRYISNLWDRLVKILK